MLKMGKIVIGGLLKHIKFHVFAYVAMDCDQVLRGNLNRIIRWFHNVFLGSFPNLYGWIEHSI